MMPAVLLPQIHEDTVCSSADDAHDACQILAENEGNRVKFVCMRSASSTLGLVSSKADDAHDACQILAENKGNWVKFVCTRSD